ncbi:hypothetical protein [Streptomyces sp. NPDC085529]
MVGLSVVAGASAAGLVGAVVAVPLVSMAWSVHTALRREARGRTREARAR